MSVVRLGRLKEVLESWTVSPVRPILRSKTQTKATTLKFTPFHINVVTVQNGKNIHFIPVRIIPHKNVCTEIEGKNPR